MEVKDNEIKILNISEIRPGMVLFEENFNFRGLKKGHVLTEDDVEQLKISKKYEKLKVMITNKDKFEIKIKNVEQPKNKKDLKEEIKSKDLSIDQKVSSLTNEFLDKKLKELVELKKENIRGDDYQERLNTYKEEQKKKFIEYLKSTGQLNKDEVHKFIDHYSTSVADIESLEKTDDVPTGELFDKLLDYEKKAKIFQDSLLAYKQIFTSYVEEIVVDILNDVGYRLTNSLLANSLKSEFAADYIANHSLQVLIVSIITAIELTKIVQEKNKMLKEKDWDVFASLSKKFFTIDELVNLGIAALLHDIGFKKEIPEFNSNYKFSIQNQSIIDLHPSIGYHLTKNLNLDFEVPRTIYQHCERFDGSGYPSGLFPRYFTKYTPVLMFAEYFVESITKNPIYDKVLTPRETIIDILKNKRHQFDGDVVYAFVRASSLYPIGSWVLLDNNNVALVIGINKNNLEKPLVRVFFDENRNAINSPYDIDLKNEQINIAKPIDVQSIRSWMQNFPYFVLKTFKHDKFDNISISRIVI